MKHAYVYFGWRCVWRKYDTEIQDACMDGRRWKPPLTEEKLNAYLTGGMLAPYPQYVEALITGNFTGSGEAIKAAIARNSWA